MSRTEALLGSAAFFLIAPGTVAGLIPWWITRWQAREESTTYLIVGAVMCLIGAAVLIECFVRFALHGRGTPAPIAPTERLVVTGLYRHVRNPMYVGVTLLIFGQMFLFAHPALMAYGVVVWLAFFAFVLIYEEPTLRRRYGDEYVAFCQSVPRWIPRLTPWHAPPPDAAPPE